MSSVGKLTLNEQVACETTIIVLESPIRDKTYVTPEAWDNMETYLCGKNEFQVCIYYLKGEAQALAKLWTELIRVVSLKSQELLALPCKNSESTCIRLSMILIFGLHGCLYT